MSGLTNAFAWAVLASGLLGGLLALYGYVSAGWVILDALGFIAAVIVVAVAAVYVTGRRHRDDFADLDAYTDPDEHMGPLRQPGDAEKTLALDLGQRRMLLPGTRGQRGRHAAGAPQLPAIPPSAEARTESIPVVPAEPAVQEPTEVIPVITEPVAVRLAEAAKPDAAFPVWDTGQFALDIKLLGVSHAGDES